MRRSTELKRRPRKIKYLKRFSTLLSHPLFWFLTFAGNAMILMGGILLYFLESKVKPSVQFIDCLLWSTSIVTTIGYAGFSPESYLGKITVMGLMLLGTFFLWSYMALLVSALISPSLSLLEEEVQNVEQEISDLKVEEQKTQFHKNRTEESL